MSNPNASFSNPISFNTTTVNLDCSAVGTVEAILSGPASDGSLLVDNNIQVSANSGTPVNVCPSIITNSGEGINTNNCFSSTYESAASGLAATNTNTDTYLETNGGGVPEIDLGSSLPGGFGLVLPSQLNSVWAAGYDRPFASLEDGVAVYVARYLATADRYR